MRATLCQAHRATPTNSGFTLSELLVVVGIISMLTALLLPVLAGARRLAQTAACANNLRQIYHGVLAYAASNEQRLPCPPRSQIHLIANYAWGNDGATPQNWFTDVWIANYLGGCSVGADGLRATAVARCPAMGRDGTTQWPTSSLFRDVKSPGSDPNFSYAFNAYAMGGADANATWSRRLGDFDAKTMLLTETCNGGRIGQDRDVNGAHYASAKLRTAPQVGSHYGGQHDGMANVLFCDGTVVRMPIADVPIMDPQRPVESLSPRSKIFWHNTLWLCPCGPAVISE